MWNNNVINMRKFFSSCFSWVHVLCQRSWLNDISYQTPDRKYYCCSYLSIPQKEKKMKQKCKEALHCLTPNYIPISIIKPSSCCIHLRLPLTKEYTALHMGCWSHTKWLWIKASKARRMGKRGRRKRGDRDERGRQKERLAGWGRERTRHIWRGKEITKNRDWCFDTGQTSLIPDRHHWYQSVIMWNARALFYGHTFSLLMSWYYLHSKHHQYEFSTLFSAKPYIYYS